VKLKRLVVTIDSTKYKINNGNIEEIANRELEKRNIPQSSVVTIRERGYTDISKRYAIEDAGDRWVHEVTMWYQS